MKNWVGLTISVLLFAGTLTVSGTEILFFGNSFTFMADVPNLVREIAKSKGRDVKVKSLTEGGVNWTWHLKQEATEAALTERQWDWVVLQDQPMQYKNPYEQLTNAVKFYQRIRAHSPNAKILLYQTWPYAPDAPFYKKDGATPEQMAAAIFKMHADSAKKIEALDEGRQVAVAPVGEAFVLCVKTQPEFNLYEKDRQHANPRGSYLAALVLYATLFDDSPLGAAAKLRYLTVDPEKAALLQKIAEEVTAPNR